MSIGNSNCFLLTHTFNPCHVTGLLLSHDCHVTVVAVTMNIPSLSHDCHVTVTTPPPDLLVHPLEGQGLGLQSVSLSACGIEVRVQLRDLVRKFRESLLKLLYLIRCRGGEKADIDHVCVYLPCVYIPTMSVCTYIHVNHSLARP